MTEHIVFVDTIGGSMVLSCEALQIKNIEYFFKELTPEGIKQCILKYKYLKEEDCTFDIKIVDNRPEPQNYNDVKEKESKNFKKENNSMRTPRY